jgi:hypothetical protein
MAFTRATHGRVRSTNLASPPRHAAAAHRRPGARGRAVHARLGAVPERAPCRGGACVSGSADSVPLLGAQADRSAGARTAPRPCRAGSDRARSGVGREGFGIGRVHACARIGELLARVVAGRWIDPSVRWFLATFMSAVRDPLAVQ